MSEKTKLPKFIVDVIEKYYSGETRTNRYKVDFITYLHDYIYVYGLGDLKVKEWVKEESNYLKLIVAIATDNYDIEEERFYWRKKEYSVFSFENYDHSYLNIVTYNSIQSICFGDKFEGKYSKTKLTTQEVFSLLTMEDIAQLERIKVED